MRWVAAMILAGGVICSGVEENPEAEPEIELPGWEEDELKDLESGEYVPGSSLIGRLARESLDSDEEDVIELAEAVKALPEDDLEPKEDPKVIPEEFLNTYFREPAKGLLNDPQELLTTQEFRDRAGFLSYHARDVGIEFYLYLFGEEQEIPDGLELAGLVDAHFDPAKPAAVVFYFLGAPERSQLVYSQRVLDLVGEEERDKVLRMSREEAEEKSDSLSQLEVFSMQMSVRLAGLEEVIVKGGGRLVMPEMGLMDGGDGVVVEPEVSLMQSLVRNEPLFWGVVGTGILVTAGMMGFLGRWIAARRRTYVFPDAEGATLLDAPYAAGVGGVLSFASAQTPPSRQQSDVPDYLQKM